MSQARTQASSPGRTHPVDEILPTGRLAILGFHHVLAMYDGAVAVPLLLRFPAGGADRTQQRYHRRQHRRHRSERRLQHLGR
jgi:xanthine/uracil permease